MIRPIQVLRQCIESRRAAYQFAAVRTGVTIETVHTSPETIYRELTSSGLETMYATLASVVLTLHDEFQIVDFNITALAA